MIDSQSPGGVRVDPLPRGGPAVSPGHRRVGPALVHEDQPLRVHAGEVLAEGPSLLPDLRAVLLGGRGTFFLRGSPSRDRAREMVARLHEEPRCRRHSSSVASGRSRMSSRSRSRSSGVSTAGWPPPWGLGSTEPVVRWSCNSRVTKETLTRNRCGDLAQGPVTAQDRIDDPLSEILGIGCHRSPPHRDLHSNGARIQVKGAVAIPRAPGPQPPRCWQSRSRLAPPIATLAGEDTLSRGLRTPPLPATHASVGDCWQNSRCRHLLLEEQHTSRDTFVSHADGHRTSLSLVPRQDQRILRPSVTSAEIDPRLETRRLRHDSGL